MEVFNDKNTSELAELIEKSLLSLSKIYDFKKVPQIVIKYKVYVLVTRHYKIDLKKINKNDFAKMNVLVKQLIQTFDD